MKTSNIILISYLSLMLLYFSTYFIPYHGNEVKYSIRTIKINDFRYLKLMPGTNVTFVKDVDNFMEIPVPENSKTPEIYEFNGDTLVIQAHQTPIKFEKIKIHGRVITTLVSDSALCYLAIKTDSLKINGTNQSSFFFDYSEIENLAANLKGKSKINGENSRINSMNLRLLDKSEFYINQRIRKAQIELKEKSTMKLGIVDSLMLNQDGSNTININTFPSN